MVRINRQFIWTVLLISALAINLLNVNIARADGETPPPPEATEEPTEPPTEALTEPYVESTATPIPAVEAESGATSIPEESEAPTEAESFQLIADLPAETTVVALDENGYPVSLASQEAASLLVEADPMWCPEGVLPNGPGCTTNLTISALLALMQTNAGGQFSANGVIYFERSGITTYTTSFVLDDSAGSLGASYTSIKNFRITLRGGWNGGATNSFSASQSSLFDNNNNTIVRVGSSVNPWVGNVTIQDIEVQDNDGGPGPVNGAGLSVYTTTGNISLNDVDVDNQADGQHTAYLSTSSGNITVTNGSSFDGSGNNQGFYASTTSGSITITGTSGNRITFTDAQGSGSGTNYNGATLSAPVVSLTYVTADDNDLNGISISNANQVTLNNVIATDNGTDISGGSGGGGFSNDFGAGVLVNGNVGSFVSILDGTFTGNQRYGIQIVDTANTSVFVGSSIDSCQTTANSGGCSNATLTTDTTAPTIAFSSRTPAANGFGWNNSNVTVTWTCTDAGSGVVSPTVSVTVTTEGAGQSATGICTNKAGLTSSNTQTNINIDTAAPTIAFVNKTPAPNANGWNSTDVTVNWSCADALSGMVSGTTSQTLTSEGANQSTIGTCTDRAGNSATNTQTGINIDKTAPTGVTLTPSGTLGNNGWYTSNVSITTTGTDSVSTINCTAVQSLNADSAGTLFNGSCTNLAGLTTNAAPISVKRDATQPIITFLNRTAPNGSGWNNTDVTVNWSCSDAMSGPVSANASQTLSTDGANQSSTGICADLAGLTASNTQSGINIDKTAPTANANALPAPNANGWNNSNVTVSFTGSDAGSGIASCTASQTLSSEGAGQSASGVCTDVAGNSSTLATASGINIDKTSPTANATASPAPNINGWNNTIVTVSFSGTDTLSGIDFCDANIVLSTESAGQSATGDCTDQAGNVSSSATASGINIDLTQPVLNLPANITTEATSASGAVVNYSASANDALDPSPAFNCAPASGTTFPLGVTSVNCTATDQAGNSQTGGFSVTVQDTTAPVISPMSNIVTSTNGTEKVVTYVPPFTTDLVDGAGVATCVPASGSIFPVGTTTVTCSATDSHGNTSTMTFTVEVTMRSPSNSASTGNTSSLIVVTGNSIIDLNCLTSVNAFGVLIKFHNLCNRQAGIETVSPDSLPAALPNGYSFVKGLELQILDDGEALKSLPENSGIQFDFPTVGNNVFAILFWNNGQWVEITQPLNISNLANALSSDAANELYKLSSSNKAHQEALTTELTGIFILVKK